MQALICSDLHLEFGPMEPPRTEVALVILAGDTAPGTKALTNARSLFPQSEIIMLAGNHEYYGHAIPKLTDELRAEAANLNIYFLENDEVTINDVRFFGCTLWTDFKLFGHELPDTAVAGTSLNDYKKIRVSPHFRKFKPSDAASMHRRSRRWLEQHISEGSTRSSVIITHHAPSMRSLAPRRRDDPESAAYASHLDELVERSGAQLWIHGHTHHCVDYKIGSTRVLSNQRGYVPDTVPGFQPDLVVEIDA